MSVDTMSRRDHAERAVDGALDASFPASDAPPWTLGVAPPDAESAAEQTAAPAAAPTREPSGGPVAGQPAPAAPAALSTWGGVDDEPVARHRTLRRRLLSLLGACAAVLLAPVVIVIAGLPIVFGVRVIAGALGWLLGGQ